MGDADSGNAGSGNSDGAFRPVLAGPPNREAPLPAGLQPFAAGRSVKTVWRNELGGLTWQFGTDAGRKFAKWAPTGSGLDLNLEAQKMRWAAGFLPVPTVLAAGADDTGEWLVTAGLPGDSAVSPAFLAEPQLAVRAVGYGLRRLHEVAPVAECPYSWSVENRLEWAAVEAWTTAPPIDKLVVCHGDPCVPNTLVDRTGAFTGLVDLAARGVADRWADLAVATMSTRWNYGPGWEEELLDAYGIDPDLERIAFYRQLWNAT